MIAPPQQPTSYPMTYVQGSPLSSLGYNHPALYPPQQQGLPGYGLPIQGYGAGLRPGSSIGLAPSNPRITGSKSTE